MYLSSIFQHLQKANLSLQGKKKNVFVLNSRIESLKTKVELWKAKAEQSDFSSFAEFNEFLHTCEWESPLGDVGAELARSSQETGAGTPEISEQEALLPRKGNR